MYVRLVSVQRAVSIMTPEQLVAFCARVSNPENQWNHETSERLLKYLMDHKHWSPFEMVNVCMEIKTTRDIARQNSEATSVPQLPGKIASAHASDRHPRRASACSRGTARAAAHRPGTPGWRSPCGSGGRSRSTAPGGAGTPKNRRLWWQ